MPKVSVIIPVYNTEKYLRACLNSVVDQTLEDIEILCIDDCSTDSSLKILREYAQRDFRLKVLQNSENKGLSATRNVGIDNACGEYVQFVDSDDLLESDALEQFYEIATGNQLDMLKYLTNRQKEMLFNESTANHVLSGKDMLVQLVGQRYCYISGCIMFLNRQFMKKHNLRFSSKMRYVEDGLFTFQVICAAQRCMCINENKYIYVKREDSLTTSAMTSEKLYAQLYLMYRIFEFILHDKEKYEVQQAQYAYFEKCYDGLKRELEGWLETPDTSGWEPEVRRMFQIFLSGHGWLQGLIDREKLIVNKESIYNAKRLYVFGAGRAAQQLVRILYKAGIEIDGMIVSDVTKNRKSVYGYRVFSVDEINTEDGQPLILSAVKSNDTGVSAILKRYGFENIVDVCT